MKFSISTKIYITLILALSALSSINIFLPQGDFIGQSELPASKPVVAVVVFLIMAVVYGGLGFVGLTLARKLGFAEIWDRRISNKQRFLTPMMIGAGIGLFFILSDLFFAQFHSLGSLPHPPFPTSIVASVVAGIGEEIMFRLFFVSFWVWLISYVLLRKRWQNQIFWVVAVISALVFAIGHFPSVMMILEIQAIRDIPVPLIIELVLLNGVLSIFSANYFRKFGFLAAVGIHFWADVVWHVLYGGLS